MTKIILFWCVVIGLMLFTVLSYAQPVIVLDPEGNYKALIVLPLPPPQWR